MKFIGNALGYDKAAGQNEPGQVGSIGAFTQLGGTGQVGTYPVGTTLNWKENGSSAQLSLPPGTSILHAQLIWFGSYEMTSGPTNDPHYYPLRAAGDSNALTDGITFTTPLGSQTVLPQTNETTTASFGSYYISHAEVSNLVRASGAGTYSVSGVVATVGAAENAYNVAGWALGLVLGNGTMPARVMALYTTTGLVTGTSTIPAQLGAFRTAFSRPASGRLHMVAGDGDAGESGDQVMVGADALNMVPVARNGTTTSFFYGGIDAIGGWPAGPNHSPGAPTSGARQGIDIATVPLDAYLAQNQTNIMVRPITTGPDLYAAAAMGIELEVEAPTDPTLSLTADRTFVLVGDQVIFTTVFDNTTSGVDAIQATYHSHVPAGMSFIPGSVQLNGVTLATANPETGINVGVLDSGNSITLSYKFRVEYVRPDPYDSTFNVTGHWDYKFQSAPDLPLVNMSTIAGEIELPAARLEPVKAASPTTALAVDEVVTYTITVPNTGTHDSTLTVLRDPLPSYLDYVANSTTLNGTPVADVGGLMPYSSDTALYTPQYRVKSPSATVAGTIKVGEAAVITYQAKLNTAMAVVENTAYIDPDGPDPGPEIMARAVNPVGEQQVDLAIVANPVTQTVVAGNPASFQFVVTNNGPATIPAFNLAVHPPEMLQNPTFTVSTGTYNPETARWTDLNGGAGLAQGESVTLTISGKVDPFNLVDFSIPAVIFPGIGSLYIDTEHSNDSAEAHATNTRIADLELVKIPESDQLPRGSEVVYIITVTNHGPSAIDRVYGTDTPVSGLLPETMYFTFEHGYFNPDNYEWSGLALAPGQTARLLAHVTTVSGGGIRAVNTATVLPNGTYTDPNTANNSFTTDNNVVMRSNHKVEGYLYNDLNFNGVKDANEGGLGINGLYMKLRPATGGAATNLTKISAGDGSFKFTSVGVGEYIQYADDVSTMSSIAPLRLPAWVPTYPPYGELDLIAREYDQYGANIGYYNGSRVDGIVWLDDGGDGTGIAADGIRQPGETLMGGVRIQALGPGGVLIQEVYTDTSGRYRLYIPSIYEGQQVSIKETNPPGFISVSDNTGTYTDYLDVEHPSGAVYDIDHDTLTFTMGSGRLYKDLNFGDGGPVTISGFVYQDQNRSGTKDAGEEGLMLASIVVKVFDYQTDEFVVAAVVNPVTGAWSAAVASVSYKLIVDNNVTPSDNVPYFPPGWSPTVPPDATYPQLIVSGVDIEGINFGFYEGIDVTGRVFEDNGAGGGTAHDGQQNGTEMGLAGVTVELLDASGAVIQTAVTNASGDYLLWFLPNLSNPGFTVRQTNLPGWTSVSGYPGLPDGTYDRASDRLIYPNLEGQAPIDATFGDVRTPTLVEDQQEFALPGTVVLYHHVFTPSTAGEVEFAVNAVYSPGETPWSEVLYLDEDGDGALTETSPQVTGPITVLAGEVLHLVLVQHVPPQVSWGASSLATLSATFTFADMVDPIVWSGQNNDLTIVGEGAGVSLLKEADKDVCLPGEEITYTLTYRHDGLEPVTSFAIKDAVPTYTTFVSAAFGTTPAGLTAGTGPTLAVGETGDLVWTFDGELVPGTEGTVTYIVKVDQ